MAAINRTRCAHQGLKEGVLSHFIKNIDAYASFGLGWWQSEVYNGINAMVPESGVMSCVLAFLT